MSKAPRITKNSNGDYDLLFEDGNTQWAEDGTEAAQYSLQRFLTYKDEMTLGGNLTSHDGEGTDFYGIIFSSSTSRAEKEFEIKRRLYHDNINKILSFEWEKDGHTLVINAKLQTAWGAETISDATSLL